MYLFGPACLYYHIFFQNTFVTNEDIGYVKFRSVIIELEPKSERQSEKYKFYIQKSKLNFENDMESEKKKRKDNIKSQQKETRLSRLYDFCDTIS